MLIEIIENALQIAVLLVCTGIALYRAVTGQSRAWTLLFFFYGSWMLGDVYWLACVIFFGVSPMISVISNLSWYAAGLFLYLLLRETSPLRGTGKKSLLPWIGFVFSGASAVFFMQWGDYLSNLICAVLMGLLAFAAIRRLTEGEQYRKQRFLLVAILVYYLIIYALWFASCFWEYTFTSPYYWIDILLSVSFPVFLPATKKVVAV